MKESPTDELMIYIENIQDSPPHTGVGKEVDELMDVEYNVEDKELDVRLVPGLVLVIRGIM